MKRSRPRFTHLGMCAAVVLALVACGGAPSANTATSVPTQAPAATPAQAPTAAPPTQAPAPTEAAATAAPAPAAEASGSLTVLDWAGYDAPDFWIDFKNAYPNITPNFEIGASDADIYAKMK